MEQSILESIDKIKEILDNIDTKKKTRKEKDSVSLVGIAMCSDGVLGFGDKKMSLQTPKGNFIEDNNKPEIKKVYSNNNLIMVFHGLAQFQQAYIDELLNNIMLISYNIDDFIYYFTAMLERCNECRNYRFVIYDRLFKNDIYEVEFNNKKLIYKEKQEWSNCIVKGDYLQTQIFSNYFKKIYGKKLLTIDELKKELQTLNEHLYFVSEMVLDYNSVSKELEYEVIEF